jgi:antirestriction protein ArdC
MMRLPYWKLVVSSETKLDWQQLIDQALTMPGNVGETYNRFYRYSYLNQLYLAMQGVREPVATYKRWQDLGRQVLRGSKAASIVRPIIIEKKDAAGEVKDRITRFKPVKCLFTVSQTEGDELPPADIPSWSLATALDELDIKQVPFEHMNGNVAGYSVEREFAINPVAVNPTKTTFHEVGHIVLGHTDEARQAEYQLHRGVSEFQAEATAYLSMNELEQLDDTTASQSRGYVQTWLKGQRPPDTAIRQVFSATDQILRAGRPVMAETVNA